MLSLSTTISKGWGLSMMLPYNHIRPLYVP